MKSASWAVAAIGLAFAAYGAFFLVHDAGHAVFGASLILIARMMQARGGDDSRED